MASSTLMNDITHLKNLMMILINWEVNCIAYNKIAKELDSKNVLLAEENDSLKNEKKKDHTNRLSYTKCDCNEKLAKENDSPKKDVESFLTFLVVSLKGKKT